MVGIEELKKTFADYAYSVEAPSRKRQIITIHGDLEGRLRLDCALSENHLTELYFLNNQFYDLDEETLLQVADDIVNGRYIVKANFTKTSKWLVTMSLGIGPERTVKVASNAYKDLPLRFNKRKYTYNEKNEKT